MNYSYGTKVIKFGDNFNSKENGNSSTSLRRVYYENILLNTISIKLIDINCEQELFGRKKSLFKGILSPFKCYPIFFTTCSDKSQDSVLAVFSRK